jgi:hypothetical protein
MVYWPRRHYRRIRLRTYLVRFVVARLREAGPFKMSKKHISDQDLERYHLGMVPEETELCAIEQHLIGCEVCVRGAEEAAVYVDLIKAAIVKSRRRWVPLNAKILKASS